MSDPSVGRADDDSIAIARHTRRWIERFVVGLNLCPFAAPLFRDKTARNERALNQNLDSHGEPDTGPLRVAVCANTRPRDLAAAVFTELELLRTSPADAPVTSLLVFSAALQDFDDYLDFLALAEELLYECELEGIVQIASFHPHYQFDGADVDDVANFTNRAPYPMLHFLREDAVLRAVESHPAPEQIPVRNVERLRSLGTAAVHTLLRDIEQEQ